MSRINPVRKSLTEDERLDDHHKMILHFIKNNPECTENQVVKAMDAVPKGPSKMTTLKKLDELIEQQEISDLLKENESGFHRFIINEHNEFNKIYAGLSEIESIMELMSEPMKTFISITGGNPKMLPSPDRWIVQNLDDKFIQAYREVTGEMLDVLLLEASNKIQSQKDAWILYKKIIELKIKYNKQNSWFEGEGVEGLYLTSNAFIQFHAQDLDELEKEDLKYAEEHGIPINSLIESLKLRTQDFKRRFLPYPKYPSWGKSNDNIFFVSDEQQTDSLAKGQKKSRSKEKVNKIVSK